MLSTSQIDLWVDNELLLLMEIGEYSEDKLGHKKGALILQCTLQYN